MRYFKYVFLVATLLVLTTFSCERDDICASTTPTTPHLIIRFYDASNSTATKVVRELEILNEDDERYAIFSSTDSIILPLPFQEEGQVTTARFKLEKDSDYADDENPDTVSNTDIIEVTYTPEFVYVSRACGYKSIFNSTNLTIVNDANRWIINRQIITSTIDNENAAHINIFH